MIFVLRQLRFLCPSAESVATGAPLIAALLAPAATLFDIPALSQRWYSFNGTQISDPPASLILSAISLAFSVLANGLLVLRFCVHNPRGWRIAILVSTLSWFMKTAIGFSNLIVFGATRRNGPGFAYIEGFWCAIMSVILSGFVTILLSAHYMTNQRDRPEGSVNLDCRMLIISEMILFAVMALEALIFCKIEGWTYLDGLYFSVVSLLTIGFGNFAPTKASTKVLLFPFSIAGIALLSNQVTLITSVSSRLTTRYRQRLNYGPKLHQKLTRQLTKLSIRADDVKNEKTSTSSAEQDDLSVNDELMREVHRLKRLYTLQEGASEMFEFLFSLLLLVLFWFVSGAIFQAIEGWTFGDAMYFSYIFFLTIGYGDYAPNTPAGKTVFVFWAMLAVPIMTNFVVQTIQTIVSRTSTLLTNRTRERKTEWFDYVATYFVPHTDLVDQVRASIDGEVEDAQQEEEQNEESSKKDEKSKDREKGQQKAAGDDVPKNAAMSSLIKDTVKEREGGDDEMITISRSDLLYALEQSILLESQCRAMLIDQMKTGSAQWLLLKADSNVQRSRLVSGNLSRIPSRHQQGEGDPHKVDELQASSEDTMLERVGSYRQTYARFLVMAGRLMSLEGQDLFAWEHEVEHEGRMARARLNTSG